MTKSRILAVSVVVLLALNLGLLIFIFSHRPHPPKSFEDPKEVIIERLHLDKEQVGTYEVLIKAHQAAIQKEEWEMNELKSQLYGLLEQSDQSQSDSLLNEIALKQREIESIHFAHFNDLKDLCHTNQLDDFHDLSKELLLLFSPRSRRKK